MHLGLRILFGAVAAIAIAALARRAGSLSRSGAIAAAVIGAAAVAAGWNWGALLVAYFVSSSLLSRLGRPRKRLNTAGMIEKAGPRDAIQVLSNGLPFAILATSWAVDPDAFGAAGAVMCAAATSLSASAADTWATEIGIWVGQKPRSILTLRPIPAGQSGGITIPGLLGSFAGAAFISAVAGSLGWRRNVLATIVVGGILGALVDSFAGAILQQRRWCDACAVTTEMRTHDCGAPTRHAGGLAFMNNDAVNLLATTVGALFGLLVAPGIPN
jgi:uncharacterized protein (TIGR00297 family)